MSTPQSPYTALRSSLCRVAAVGGNTLREAIRTRVFYGLLAAAVALLGFSVALSDLAVINQQARIVQDFGLFAISLVGVATAIVMGVVLLHNEIEKKTLYFILPKPVRRAEFLLGKFVGLVGLLSVELLVLAAVWIGVLALRGGEPEIGHFTALYLALIEIVIVTAIATFFSALSSPVLSGVFTLGFFIVGRISYVITDLMNARHGLFSEVPAAHTLGRVIVTLAPDLSTFNVSDDLLQGAPIPPEYVVAATGYGLSYAAVFLLLAVLVFERRDFI